MSRHDENHTGAVFKLRKKPFEVLAEKHPEFTPYMREWNYRNSDKDSTVSVPIRRFTTESLKTLLETHREINSPNDKWLIGQIISCMAILTDPEKALIKGLRPLETALIAWIRKDIINGWVFVQIKDSALQAMIVDDIWFTPRTTNQDGSTNPPYTSMQMAYWQRGAKCNHTVRWYTRDIRTDETITTATSQQHGIYHETPDLIETYERDEKRFLEWRTMLGEQFVGNGKFTSKERWSEHDEDMHATRLVVDDRCDDIQTHYATSVFIPHDTEEDIGDDLIDIEEDSYKYDRMPLGFYIWCFNLSSYRGGFVHIDAMTPYVYRPELREKLILKPEHSDLIDALTADMDVLMEDIISGKTGGTCIMCQGDPGTGKTLTAEVYAEITKRPLYRVHSGQLGTDAESVEEGLMFALNNAKRWRAILLIDEGDVFVSKRNDDLEKNAVVGVFLRTLEYYDGILFLTTNRVDTIDTAILSRCIAHIKYELPSEAERVKLWMTLGGVYGLKLIEGKGMAERLAKRFDCSGRDIKGLIRLVTKYARQHDKKPTFKDFERLAVFKGL